MGKGGGTFIIIIWRKKKLLRLSKGKNMMNSKVQRITKLVDQFGIISLL